MDAIAILVQAPMDPDAPTHYGITRVAVDAMVMLVLAATSVLQTPSPCQAHNTWLCTPAKLLGPTYAQPTCDDRGPMDCWAGASLSRDAAA